jgi:hypothetical protein
MSVLIGVYRFPTGLFVGLDWLEIFNMKIDLTKVRGD